MIHQMSHMGTYHSAENGENQDATYHGSNRDYAVITLADGVSTCKKAKHGAEIASRAIAELLLQKGDRFLAAEGREAADFALAHILHALRRQAAEDGEEMDEYASTIAAALWDKKAGKMLCFNLGDSLILGVGNGQYRVLAMPGDSTYGCCVTTTKNALAMTTIKVVDASLMESVVLCSDGAWRPMFCKNRMKPEVAEMLVRHDFEGLKAFLNGQDCYDDYSFISMSVQPERRRNIA